MKTRKKLLIALLSATCITAGAFGLAACKDKETTDNRDPQIVAVYNMYVANAEANNQDALSYEDWIKTVTGPQGPKGDAGTNGTNGTNGKSAYEIAKENGFTGTEAEWLASLKGADGTDGVDGSGQNGVDGATWLSGATAPAATDGKVGDLYLDTATSNVYKKTAEGWGEPICNIKGATGGTGATGEQGPQGDTGSQGEQGAAGVGIAKVEFDESTGELWITYTDSTEEDPHEEMIQLPISVHEHTYGELSTIFDATLTTEGLAYKTCTNEKCSHVEVVVLPVYGTVENPLVVSNSNKSTDVTLTDQARLKYVAPDNGYLVVSTAGQGYDPDCNFTVYKNPKFTGNSLYGEDDKIFDTSYTTYTLDHYFKVSSDEAIYVYAQSGTINFRFYSTGNSYEKVNHKVTVTGPDDSVVEGATVGIYEKTAGGEYKAVEGLGADFSWGPLTAKTNAQGVATFNLALGNYYFSVEAPEAAELKPVAAADETVKINSLVRDITVKLKSSAIDGAGTYELVPGKEYTLNIASGDTTSYKFSLSAGNFVTVNSFVIPVDEFSEEISVADVTNGVAADQRLFVTEFENSEGKVVKFTANMGDYSGLGAGAIKFTVSEACTLVIDDGMFHTAGTYELKAGTTYKFVTPEDDDESYFVMSVSGGHFVSVTYEQYGDSAELISGGNKTSSVVAWDEAGAYDLYAAVGKDGNITKIGWFVTYIMYGDVYTGVVTFTVSEDCTLTIAVDEG